MTPAFPRSRSASSWLAAACAVACACSSPSEHVRGVAHPAVDHGYPMDAVLRVNHLQVKATHNSYHVESPGNLVPELHYTHAPLDVQLEKGGVRGFELDPRFSKAAGHFEVIHIPFIDEGTTCRAFVDCLTTLRVWSDAHRGHAPLLVQIEPKDAPDGDDPETYFSALEAEILRAWPRDRILAPDDVQRDAATLRDALRAHGWPTLGETRGTVLFYVDNHAEWRRLYTRDGRSLEGRLMFVDAISIDDPLAAVKIVNEPTQREEVDAAVRAGLLVRTRADEAGLPEQRAAALATGAQLLSTDDPAAFTLPGGTPSRCNPVSAPAGCTSLAIEDPAHLR